MPLLSAGATKDDRRSESRVRLGQTAQSRAVAGAAKESCAMRLPVRLQLQRHSDSNAHLSFVHGAGPSDGGGDSKSASLGPFLSDDHHVITHVVSLLS